MSGLKTKLDQFTMAPAYFENGLGEPAIFELFVRTLPPRWPSLVTAGLDQSLEFLANLRFSADEIDFLRSQPVFKNVSRELLPSARHCAVAQVQDEMAQAGGRLITSLQVPSGAARLRARVVPVSLACRRAPRACH